MRDILTPEAFYIAQNAAFLLQIPLFEAAFPHTNLPADFYEKLAAVLNMRYSVTPPEGYAVIIDKEDYQAALKTFILPLEKEGQRDYWHAPIGKMIAHFFELAEKNDEGLKRFILTSPEHFKAYFHDTTKQETTEKAINSLKAKQPQFSAANPFKMQRLAALLWGFSLSFICLSLFNNAFALGFGLLFNGFVFLWLSLRLVAAFSHKQRKIIIKDIEYPQYSLIIALYNESNMVKPLVKALDALDYPKEKLDILFILEEDDEATLQALIVEQQNLNFSVIVAPNLQPRTKPKALMVALPYVRGEFVCVFDAEDIPHVSQLKEAISLFADNDNSLAVAQAPLTIRNEQKNLLTALFSLDYASLFTSTLPFLARFNMPLPIGGTSNHFRVEALKKAGGWDPYNVTEDADLGLRLARLGYKAATLTYETSEEAPERFSVWLKQRTRWYKGWLQTIAVHYSHPVQLFHDLGALKLSVYSVMIIATFLSSLFHPFVLGLIGYGYIIDNSILSSLCVRLLGAGYGLCALIYMVEIGRKGAYKLAPFLIFLPLYWLILSLAAWRALIELYTKPYHWHKTPHGH